MLRALFKSEVKFPAAAHEGEASFASDSIWERNRSLKQEGGRWAPLSMRRPAVQ
jgi:hypothetical protein